MSDDIFDRINRAGQSLRDCLSEMDAGSPDDADIGRRFDAMREAFQELGDLAALWDQVPEEEEEHLQASLEELMRLNSVLTRVVQRDEERLLSQLSHARQGRIGLEALRQGGQPGGNCDISG